MFKPVVDDNLRGCSIHSFHRPLRREQVLDLGVDLLHVIVIIIVVMVANIIFVTIASATCSWSSSSESCRPRAAFWYFFFSEVYLHKIFFTDVLCKIFI